MTTPRHSRVIRAEQLTERHFGRWVRVGQVVGELIALEPMPAGLGVNVVALVGGCRAEFPLRPDAHVEHWRKDA